MSDAATRQRPLLGVVLIVGMAACFATLDSSAKKLGALLPVLVVLWARYAFQAAAMGLWLLGTRRSALLRAVHPRFQLVRGSLLLSVSALGFFGLRFMPVAEFTAVVMLTPLLVTLLAALLFGEEVSPLRWALVIGGFAGALIIVRPGSGLFGWVALLPALAALLYAAFQLLTRRLAGLEHPLTTHFCTGLVGTAVCSLLLAVLPTNLLGELARLDAAHTALLLAVGALGTVGHLLLIFALGMAPMSLLMPFTYLQVLFATLIGGWMFAHVPDAWAATGMGVIAACGAAAAWLNAREAQQRREVSVVAADTVGD